MPDKRRFVPRSLHRNPGKPKRAAEMPTEIKRPSAPIAERARTPGLNSREATPLSLTALTIIAILVLVIHVVSGEMIARLHGDSLIFAPADEFNYPVDAKPPELSLPFD
jgi:hypothetical protein